MRRSGIALHGGTADEDLPRAQQKTPAISIHADAGLPRARQKTPAISIHAGEGLPRARASHARMQRITARSEPARERQRCELLRRDGRWGRDERPRCCYGWLGCWASVGGDGGCSLLHETSGYAPRQAVVGGRDRRRRRRCAADARRGGTPAPAAGTAGASRGNPRTCRGMHSA
jgi:hypothetical protein